MAYVNNPSYCLNQVDWHNFVVVETVEYQQWETGNFPPPATPESVGARVLMQRRVESNPPAARTKGKGNDDGECSVFFRQGDAPNQQGCRVIVKVAWHNQSGRG